MKRLHKKFQNFIALRKILMNLTRNCTFIHFKKFEKTKIPFLTHPQPATTADRRGPGQRHSAPAPDCGYTAVDRRVLTDDDLAGDDTCTYMFPSTSDTRLGYRLNELEPGTSLPAAMAARQHSGRATTMASGR